MLRSLRPNLGLNASRGPRPTREHRQTDRPLLHTALVVSKQARAEYPHVVAIVEHLLPLDGQ